MSGTHVLGNQGQDMQTITPPMPAPRTTVTLGATEKRNTGDTANVILIDHSGSTMDMVGKGDNRTKIEGIKEAVSTFIANIPPTAYLSIIAFESTARVIWNMQSINQNKLGIIETVQQLCPLGTTAMGQGLALANIEISNVPHDIKRVYLLSDGMPDNSLLSETEAENLKNSGATIYSIGFGDGLSIDSQLLQNIASVSSKGECLYQHIKDSKTLTVFLKQQTHTITQ